MEDTAAHNERVVREAFNWDRLMKKLADAARSKRRWATQPDPPTLPGLRARMLFGHAVQVLHEVVGYEALEQAWGEDVPEHAPRTEHLQQIVHRLMLMSSITLMAERNWRSPSSFSELQLEISAIQNGDLPRLLDKVPQPTAKRSRKSGQNVNGYRLSFYKLEALCWYQRLLARGATPSEAKAALYGAYGQAWETISGWKRQIVRYLGQDIMDRELRNASREKAVFFSPLIEFHTFQQAGLRFKREYAKRLKAVR